MNNEQDALDIVQESAYKVMKDISKVREPDYLSTWIYRVVMNTAVDFLRKRQKESIGLEGVEIPHEDVYHEDDPMELLKSLEEKDRTIVVLKVIEELKLEEIAVVLDLNVNTVKARLYRALKKTQNRTEVGNVIERGHIMENDSRNNLEKLKEEYHNIPVPASARENMMAGIEKAKKEKRMRIVIQFTKKTGLTAAAALLAITVMANVSPTTANAMENIPVLGTIAKVVTFRTFEDTKDNYEAKIDIPQVSIGDQANTEVNKSIEEYANQLIAEYEKEVTEDVAGEGHYSVTSSYQVVTDNDKYLSLRINTTVIMASGADFVKIFTIDKATGQVVTLKDLFRDKADYIQALSDNIKEQMRAQMAADDSKMYFFESGEEAAEDFNQITGDESFYFNGNGELVLVFDEYTVAPGYMGVVEFTIPKSVTGDIG